MTSANGSPMKKATVVDKDGRNAEFLLMDNIAQDDSIEMGKIYKMIVRKSQRGGFFVRTVYPKMLGEDECKHLITTLENVQMVRKRRLETVSDIKDIVNVEQYQQIRIQGIAHFVQNPTITAKGQEKQVIYVADNSKTGISITLFDGQCADIVKDITAGKTCIQVDGTRSEYDKYSIVASQISIVEAQIRSEVHGITMLSIPPQTTVEDLKKLDGSKRVNVVGLISDENQTFTDGTGTINIVGVEHIEKTHLNVPIVVQNAKCDQKEGAAIVTILTDTFIRFAFENEK